MFADCGNLAPYEIQGIPMCLSEYILALEHSAHITTHFNLQTSIVEVSMPPAGLLDKTSPLP
jgi:hypothetical protein